MLTEKRSSLLSLSSQTKPSTYTERFPTTVGGTALCRRRIGLRGFIPEPVAEAL